MSMKKAFGSGADRRSLPARAVDGFKEKALTRRRHQEGQLLETRHGWAVRVYEDYMQDGVRRRRRVQKYLGDFEKLPTRRSALNEMAEELARVNDFAIQPRTTTTFREIAWKWLLDCEKRTWRPLKPSVLRSRKDALRNHILPVIGDVPVCDVRNQSLRSLTEHLVAKRTLGPSAIRSILLVVKLAVASAVDEDGNQLFPVKWNVRFINAPAVDPSKQKRPTFTTEELNKLVKNATGRMQAVVVLLAATGMRIGELLGLEVRHFDGQSLRVEQAVWRDRIQSPKTRNAYRNVELSPDVAALLKQFIGGRSQGFIFSARTGKPLGTRNVLRSLYSLLDKIGIHRRGFHAFRRFRITHLRNNHCPPGVVRFWVGHAAGSMTEVYDQSGADTESRKDVAKSLGVGFDVPRFFDKKQPEERLQSGPENEKRALMGIRAEAIPC